jgi:hypothetical protein
MKTTLEYMGETVQQKQGVGSSRGQEGCSMFSIYFLIMRNFNMCLIKDEKFHSDKRNLVQEILCTMRL